MKGKSAEYQSVQKAAQNVLEGKTSDNTGGANFFSANKTSFDKQKNPPQFTLQIGHHYFFKKD